MNEIMHLVGNQQILYIGFAAGIVNISTALLVKPKSFFGLLFYGLVMYVLGTMISTVVLSSLLI